MNSKKQIFIISIILITIISILFVSIRADYSKNYETTKKEIAGIKDIINIYKIDILLKSIRGLHQLKNIDAIYLKKSLLINNNDIMDDIKKLNDKEVELFYTAINNHKSSKMDFFKDYTQLLMLLRDKRIDIADSSFLLFEEDRELYFLITTTILDIPQIIENIGKVRALGVKLISDININTNEISFLLKSNLKTFIDKEVEIKYTINKLSIKNRVKLSSFMNSIIANFYNVQIITSNIQKGSSNLTAKEYFVKTSKLVNKIYDLFSLSNDIIIQELKIRESRLQFKLFIGTLAYIMLIIFILYRSYVVYCDIDKKEKLIKKKKKHRKFISLLQKEYIESKDLKNICEKLLSHIVNHFRAIHGSLYLLNDINKKLYLGATCGIKDDNLTLTLNLHERLISKNISGKKIQTVDLNTTKLMIIPIMELKQSIGTMQLSFDNNFDDIDIEFLKTVILLIGTYINKAKDHENSSKYLKLIDKNVLISKTDLEGNITEVSEQFCLLTQYTKDELIGKNHRIFKHKDTKKEIFTQLWNTITKGNVWIGENKNRKKDGSYYWVESYITPDYDINGNIIGYTAIRTNITNKKKIEIIAITDGLTSLYNRRHFDNIFQQQININKREKKLLAFLLIDIDHFKQYNDFYGHLEGDYALKIVAKILKKTFKRPNDYSFRLGGEEFGVLYYVKNKEDALLIANQLKENIEQIKIEHRDNTASKYLTISSGLYIIENNDNSTVDDIYKKVDEALYTSKESGRNMVNVFLSKD